MMSSHLDRVSQDVVWAVQEGIGCSYSGLHEALRVYSSAAITSAVNALFDCGALKQGDRGFRIASAQERASSYFPSDENSVSAADLSTSPGSASNSADGSFDSGVCESSEPDLVHAFVESPDDDLRRNPQDDFDEEISYEERERTVSCVSEFNVGVPEDSEEPEDSFESNAGSILAMTPITLLGLPDHLIRDLHALGIEVMYQLVERLWRLEGGAGRDGIGKDRLALVLKRMVDLSGEPPVKLSTDDKHQLSILSGSNLMYFDWFGVLCTNLSKDLDERDIRERLFNDSFNIRHDEAFSFAEFSSIFLSDSIAADKKLFDHFSRNGYPVNGDAFHVIMLPTVEELFDEGAYELPNELVHDCLKRFTSLETTENACFGLLRDKFFNLKDKTDGLGSSERIRVGSDMCFARAARRLAECEPSCKFDEENLTLQCVPFGNDDDGNLTRA